MTTKYIGETGNVQIATVAVGGVHSWTMHQEVGTVETTDFADLGVANFLGTGTRFNGTFSTYKTGAPLTIDGTVKDFFLQETSSAGQLWAGNLILTAMDTTSAHNDLVTYDYTFQGTGALTKATA